MRRFDLGRYMLCGCVAAALLAGCGESQPPIAAPGAMTQSPAHIAPRHNWMALEGRGRDLLYVSEGELVFVYTYPRGKLVGSFGVGAEFLCSDESGYVYMPAPFAGEVLVYAHGATNPTTTLNDPDFPFACSVDPTTRNVAVTSNYGNVVTIFPYNRRRGWRFGKQYSDADMRSAAFCAYDGKGNLFVDGVDKSGNFMLAEVPKGSTTFNAISVNQNFKAPGGVQRDGKYLAIADLGNGSNSLGVIYRFTISGSAATEVSSTQLQDSLARAQFWIQDSTIIGPVDYGSVRAVGFWSFPGGGSPTKTFSDTAPFGATVSVAPH
jgi:hypothetical protein